MYCVLELSMGAQNNNLQHAWVIPESVKPAETLHIMK